MATKFNIDDVVNMILIHDGIESDVEDDDVIEKILDAGNDLNFYPNQDVNAGPLQVEENHISDTGNKESGPTQARPTGRSNQQSRYKWTNKHFDLPDVPFKGSFSDPLDDIPTPLQYFKMFLDNECMEYIAEQTNLYAMIKDGNSYALLRKKLSSSLEYYYSIYRNFSLPVVLYILVKLFKISPNFRHYLEKPISTLVSLYTF